MSTHSSRILAACLSALVPLAACGGSSSSAPAASTSTATPTAAATSATPTATPTPTPSSASPTPSALPEIVRDHPFPANPKHLPATTPTGTHLSFHQSAVVTDPGLRGPKGTKGMVYERVTPLEVTKGDQSVLSSLDDADKYPGGTVWYLRYRVEILALTGKTHVPGQTGGVSLEGYDAQGKGIASVLGVFLPCSDEPDYDGLFVGSVVKRCTILVTKEGQKVAGAYTGGAITDDPSSLGPYEADPVVWER